jgi:hypothetical protein
MKKGQSVLEYAMIFVIVAAAITAMSTYVTRAVQGNLRLIENRVNAQPSR